MKKYLVIFTTILLLSSCVKEENVTMQDLNPEKAEITKVLPEKKKQIKIVNKEQNKLLRTDLYLFYSEKIKQARWEKKVGDMEKITKEITELEWVKLKEIDEKTKAGNKKDTYYLDKDLEDIMRLKIEFFQ